MNKQTQLLVYPDFSKSTLQWKGTFISEDREPTLSELFELQYGFAYYSSNKTNKDNIASIVPISKNNTVLGIPFDWGLSPNGGVFNLWLIGEVSKYTIKKARSILTNSQDVASFFTNRVTLLGWELPEPFQAEPIPSWLNNSDYNFIDGLKL